MIVLRVIVLFPNNVIAEIVDILNDFQQDKNEIQYFSNIKANSILNIELDCGVKHNDKSVAKVLINNTELYYKPKKSWLAMSGFAAPVNAGRFPFFVSAKSVN